MIHEVIIERVKAIAAAPLNRQRDMVDDLMRESAPHVNQITRGILSKMGLTSQRERHASNFQQIVFIEFDAQIRSCLADPTQTERIGNWWALLNRRSFNACRSHMSSSEGGELVVSGSTAVIRRASAMRSTANTLRQTLGREPSDIEIVDAYNRTVVESRKNPTKQGAFASVNDLVGASGPVELNESLASTTGATDGDNGHELNTHDVEPLVRTIIERCRAEKESVGRCAELWLGSFLPGSPYVGVPSPSELADVLDVAPSTVRGYMQVARAIAREVCGHDFGIEDY